MGGKKESYGQIERLLLAGFGGQGVLSLGQVLCYAGMREGKEVSWVPSYGPEMRGGTANCLVTISEQIIDSPVFDQADAAIIMNRPSLDRFERAVRPGGILLYNSSLIDRVPARGDVHSFGIPANELAQEAGNSRTANMVMLGALLELTSLLNVESVLEGLGRVLSSSKQELLVLNRRAMEAGSFCVCSLQREKESRKLAG